MPRYIDEDRKAKRPIPVGLPDVKGRESRGQFEPTRSTALLKSAHPIRVGVRLSPEFL